VRLLFWGLLLALLAVALALLGRLVDGVVLLLVPPWRIELSLFLFLCLAGALVVSSFWLAWLVQRALDFPQRVLLYQRRRGEVGSQRALREAIKALFEGRFARAERAARDAHRMRQGDRRDAWLESIESDRDLAMARLVSGAEMWAEARDSDRALDAIDRLQASGARHLHATRIALNANMQTGRWDEVLKGLRILEKRGAVHPIAAARFRTQAYRHLLADRRHDPAALEAEWQKVPEADRRETDVALHAARLLNLAGRGRSAALALEAALESHWDERLLDEYARAQYFPARERIERAERWLDRHPQDAALLRCLGQLCLRDQLWGKASSYLEESLRLQPHPATFLALARLAEAVGNEADAARYYREAAVGFSNLPTGPHDEPPAPDSGPPRDAAG
jgi:HemY protein